MYLKSGSTIFGKRCILENFFAGVKGQLSFTFVCMGLAQMISSPEFKFYQSEKKCWTQIQIEINIEIFL